MTGSNAEVGVEGVIADGQGEIINACFLVLLLPNSTTLNKVTARGASENPVCWVRGLSLVMCSTLMSRSKLRVEIDSEPFAVVVDEFDAVSSHCFSPCLCCNDGHSAAGSGPDIPERNGGEVQWRGTGAHLFASRRNGLKGQGTKMRDAHISC